MNDYKILKDKLSEVRNFIISEIMRNESIVLNDNVRCCKGRTVNNDIDLIGVIAGLYELTHLLIYQEEYDYFWHYCNKVGSDCETHYFSDITPAFVNFLNISEWSDDE